MAAVIVVGRGGGGDDDGRPGGRGGKSVFGSRWLPSGEGEVGAVVLGLLEAAGIKMAATITCPLETRWLR